MAKKKAAKKRALSSQGSASASSSSQAPRRVDLDFEPNRRPNTTLADWLNVHSAEDVTHIEKAADFWRIFLA
jgi:hypothetical protein